MRVELEYTQKGQERSAAGTLVSVGPEFVVLDNASNSFAVPIAGVTRMKMLDLPLRLHVAGNDGKPIDRTRLGMAYLRKGITWIPEYTLKIASADEAELVLRGTIVNEAEDLVHCDVHLVVGVPTFLHTDYLAPIAIGQAIRTIGAAVAPPQVSTQIMNRAAISNTIRADQFHGVVEKPVAPVADTLPAAVGNLPQLGGAAATDYTVYTRKDLTLRRGEKAIVTLFTRRIRYSHVYRWESAAPMKHYLVLHNKTDTAWTTGPCLAVTDQRPLSEDLLRYTPMDGDCEFPVSTAINIAHRRSEVETSRKMKAHSPARNVFLDLVTLRGTARLRNFENRPARIVIDIPVPGKPVEATNGGALNVDSTKLKLLDRRGSVNWQVTLERGESKELTYVYERYVPSQ